jgi:LacI family transcriptional regulator
VKIECLHLAPALDVVTSDHMQAARMGLRQLRALGYRRVGLVVAVEDQLRLRQSLDMGVLVEQSTLSEEECVPTLVFSLAEPARLVSEVKEWIRGQRVDAVLSNRNLVAGALTAAGLRIPQDVGFASLDAEAAAPAASVAPTMAGVVLPHALVGRRALEQLAIMLDAQQRGIPKAQTITCIPGSWQEGASAPRRNRRSAGSGL